MCDFCEQYGENGDIWYFNPELYQYAAKDDPSSEASGATWGMYWPEWQGVKEKAMLTGEFKVHQIVPIEDVLKIADLNQANTPNPQYLAGVCCCVEMTTGEDLKKCMNFGFLGHAAQSLADGIGLTVKDGDRKTVDEWKEEMVHWDKEGYVHSMLIWGRAMDKAYPSHICNCKVGTCFVLRNREYWGIEHQSYKSHYIAEINGLDCTGCGLCAPYCQFGSIRVDDTLGSAYIDPRICTGCGVCRQRCKKNGAISLRARADVPIAKNLW